VSLSSKSEYSNAAAAFLNYRGSAEAAQIQVDGGSMPVNTAADVQIGGLADDVAEEFTAVIDGAGIVPFPGYASPGTVDKLQSGAQGLITGHMAAEEYLRSMQEEWASYHS